MKIPMWVLLLMGLLGTLSFIAICAVALRWALH